MGQLHLLAPNPPTGVGFHSAPKISALNKWRPPSGAPVAAVSRSLHHRNFRPQGKTALVVPRRPHVRCRMSGSGYYLNLQFQYSRSFSVHVEIMKGLKEVIKTLEPDIRSQNSAMEQIEIFRYKQDSFSTENASTSFKTMQPDITSELELGRPEERRSPNKRVNGIFWILLLNLGIYVADHLFQLRQIKMLYLYHGFPAWYQFVTATFCHANWNHLSSNLFFLYIFGKLVEEEEGNFGLWISYILTGAGANLVSWLVLPRSAVSMGASGAVFGLFAISVLVKMSWDWRKILEVLILGQFVIDKVMEAAQASTGLTGRGYHLQNVNHIAHLSGALIGAALVLLVSRIPTQPSAQDVKALRGDKDKRA